MPRRLIFLCGLLVTGAIPLTAQTTTTDSLPVATTTVAEKSAPPARFDPVRIAGFSALPRTDTLVIEYSSGHCFGGAQYRMVFSPSGFGSFLVDGGAYGISFPTEWKSTGLPPLGMITLEAGEKQKLDLLLAAYRSPARTEFRLSGFWSGLTITQRRGQKIIAREIVDDAYGILPAPEALTLDTMLHALESQRRYRVAY